MPSSYSSILRLEKQATGENQGTWGTKLNTVIDLIEAAIAGSAAISTTGGDTTLTTNNSAADQARAAILLVTGTLASTGNIIIPNLTKTYIVRNATTGSFALNIKTSSGSALEVPQGTTALVWCDGSDVVAEISPTSFLNIADVPSSYSGAGGQLVKVNSGGTGLEFAAAEDQSEFASGTGIVFAQASAPSGWTQDATVNDRMLRMVSTTGAGTGGSWTISGLTVGSTTLSTTQIPAHTHGVQNVGRESGQCDGSGRKAVTEVDITSDSTGGGGSHNHSIAADAAWRPSYYNVIRATKD